MSAEQATGTNMEIALKAEAKRVTRCFQPYTSGQRADLASSHRQGHRQREAVGEFFYVHPSRPGEQITTRGQAARAGLDASS